MAAPEGAGLPLRVPLTTATKGLKVSWDVRVEARAAGRLFIGVDGGLGPLTGATLLETKGAETLSECFDVREVAFISGENGSC